MSRKSNTFNKSYGFALWVLTYTEHEEASRLHGARMVGVFREDWHGLNSGPAQSNSWLSAQKGCFSVVNQIHNIKYDGTTIMIVVLVNFRSPSLSSLSPSSSSSSSAIVSVTAVLWHQVWIYDWALHFSHCMSLFYYLWAYICKTLQIILKYWEKS